MNKLHLGEAIRACNLQGSLTTQRLHYYVKIALTATKGKEGMVIDVDLTEEDGTAKTFTSPLTEPSSSSSSSQQLLCWSDTAAPMDKQDKENHLEGSNQQLHKKQPPAAPHNNTTKPRKKTRRSSRQASVARLEAKRENTAYNRRFKMAFKEATQLIAGKGTNSSRGESVPSLVQKLNCGSSRAQQCTEQCSTAKLGKALARKALAQRSRMCCLRLLRLIPKSVKLAAVASYGEETSRG